jgi:hypothetical protein
VSYVIGYIEHPKLKSLRAVMARKESNFEDLLHQNLKLESFDLLMMHSFKLLHFNSIKDL